MHGEWVTLTLSDDVEVKVFVYCAVGTPARQLEVFAMARLSAVLEGKTEKGASR